MSHTSLNESTRRYKAYNDSLGGTPEVSKETPQSAILEAQQLAAQAEERMRRITGK